MKKQIFRIFEIVGGVFLITIGVVMIFTPGPAFVAVGAGIFLISPQHGRRVFWWLKQLWKRVKRNWFAWKFKRVVKRKIILKARKLKSKILPKK